MCGLNAIIVKQSEATNSGIVGQISKSMTSI